MKQQFLFLAVALSALTTTFAQKKTNGTIYIDVNSINTYTFSSNRFSK